MSETAASPSSADQPLAWGSEQAISSEPVTSDPALATFNDNLYCIVTYTTSDQSVWPWHQHFLLAVTTSSDGATWSSFQTIDDYAVAWQDDTTAPAQITVSTAVAALDAAIYSVYYRDTQLLWLANSDSKTWSSAAAGPGNVATNGAMGLAGFNESPYLAAQIGSGQLWHTALSGGIWLPPQRIPGASIAGNPALAEFVGRIYCLFQGFAEGEGDGHLWSMSSPDGIVWLLPQPIPGAAMAGSPALAVFDGRLYCAYQHLGTNGADGQLWYTSSPDGATWVPPQPVPDVVMVGNPSLAVLGGSLYWGYRQAGTNQPWCIYSVVSD